MANQDDHRIEQWLEALLGGDPQRSAEALAALQSPDGHADPAVIDKAVSTAALLLAVGQSEQAAVMLETIARHNPDQPMLLNNLAYAHLVGGRLDRALALWERAAVLAPHDRLIRSNLARARQRRNSN